MRIVKAASVALLALLVLILAAPFAAPVESTDGVAREAGAEGEQGEPKPSAEPGAPASDQPAEGEAPVTVIEAVTVVAEKAEHRPTSRIDPDGYSWSGRSLR